MISNIANPRYVDADGKQIVVDCVLTLADGQPLATSLNAVDGDAPTQAIYDEVKAGTHGPITAFVPKQS